MKKLLVLSILILWIASVQGQKKKMTPEVYKLWNKIEDEQLSEQGNWVSYRVTNEADRSDLILYETKSGKERFFPNSKKGQFTQSESHFVFLKSAPPEIIKALKREKVKKNKLPKDSLCIVDLKTMKVSTIKDVQSFKLSPDKGVVAIKLTGGDMKKDSTLVKKENKTNGTKLLIRNLHTGKTKAIGYVTTMEWAEKKGKMALHTTGMDTLKSDKILLYDAGSDKIQTLVEQVGSYSKLSFDEKGTQLAFIANRDTTAEKRGQEEIFYWKEGQRRAKKIADNHSNFLKEGWVISKDRKPQFLEGQNLLVYGVVPLSSLADSTLLEEEKVDLQIWNYKDGKLQPRQDVQLKDTQKESFVATYDLASKKHFQVTDENNHHIRLSPKQKGSYHLTSDTRAYEQLASWNGGIYRDLFMVNAKTGEKSFLISGIDGNPRLTEDGKYAYWYERKDTSWNAIHMEGRKKYTLSQGSFYDELNDRPMHPSPSGQVGWTSDSKLIVYDHYDLWSLAPGSKPARLTEGRVTNKRYRHVKLDKDVITLPADTSILLRYMDEDDMTTGYELMDLKTGQLTQMLNGAYKYDNLVKAKRSNKILYTKENYGTFPDLILDELDFSNPKTISAANPQQEDYAWGSIELYNWKDKSGTPRKALLAKPDGFDPSKKYPLIVNFYEKSSRRLLDHRAPYAHRSTINYTYYTNQGYVVFNPDVYYTDGYPGDSSLDAVMSSTDALIKEGFIDTTRMGLQGHSWGGYQNAYILTKTNRFACAEAGAPVVNMVSAYGGIRWGSGRSRMFQYERTQSRLGYTLWERPDLYLYNSPIFEVDKVETPVLILHNDKDGAVPWYQGIEYFVALRRLGKPAWMLNYRGEPHWPVKRQNRIDFNIRMEQFFAHYLLGDPMPVWMEKGVPAVEQGINDGLELPR